MSTPTLCPPFLALPVELHLAIASHLPWWDIYALRLTCQQMHTLLPPLTALPKYQHFTQHWWKEPLTSSYLVQSNNLTICHRCPTVATPYEPTFIIWLERGLYIHDLRAYIREFPDRPPERWSVCERCDMSLQDNQNNDWCCRWKRGVQPCDRCLPHMQRVYPGTATPRGKQILL